MTQKLVDLLREDGVTLRGKGQQRMAKCPFHDDKKPSMSVNVDKDVYCCHGCGAEGDAVTYLQKKHGWSQKNALRAVKGALQNGRQPAQPKPRKKEPPHWVPRLPDDAVARHRYLLADGTPAFTICRFAKGPKCLPYTPAKRNGKDGWNVQLALSEGRPLYRLWEMAQAPRDKQVMVVEGEKCADAVTATFPKVVVTSWAGGAKSWKRTDWSPLGGRQAAQNWLGRLAAPWKSPEAEQAREKQADPKQPKKKKEPPPPPPAIVAENQYFRILGNAADSVAVKLRTHRILLYSRPALTQSSTLISLAAYNWWLDTLREPSLTRPVCHSVGSALIRAADRQGQIDLSRVVGRGYFRTDKGRYVWNLGDRLLVDGREQELDSLEGGWHCVTGARINVAEQSAKPAERKRVAEAVERYRWRQPLDGRRFLGWLVSSVVGGALEWRPHIWMAAAAETGKSWLLKRVAARLLGPMVVRVADATPAAIARRMRSDSLPLILDEAEPDRRWIEGLMDVIRIAAGGDGERIRADGDAVQTLNPRFSVCMSSTKLANLRAADASRFQLVHLSQEGVEDWPAVERGIDDSLANGASERIRTALIHEGHEIVEEAVSVSREMMRIGHGTRGSLIGGALTAGWRWWTGERGIVPPLSDAHVGTARNDAGDALRRARQIMAGSGGPAGR